MVETADVHRSRQWAAEIGVYQNGVLQSPIYTHLIPLWPGTEFSVNIPHRENPAHYFHLRGQVGAEIVDGYVSFTQLWLLDQDGTVIAPPRPGLAFLGASDVPITTVFQSTQPRPLSRHGIWVVTIRSAERLPRLQLQDFDREESR